MMKQNLLALLSGVLFGAGLALSQMLNPNKVLAFLDMTGRWDPSLAFVMLGALAVAMPAFRWILKRPAPLFADAFHLTRKTLLEPRLLFGAAIFGIGWGITGYCPGPAVASIALLIPDALVMVAAIYAGFFAHKWLCEKP